MPTTSSRTLSRRCKRSEEQGSSMNRRFAVFLAAMPGWWGLAHAQGEPSGDLSPIVVTAPRVAESSFNVPASIDVVERAAIQDGQIQENISESLMTVPGV